LDDEVGNFKVGKYFDALIVNMKNKGKVDVIKKYENEKMVKKLIYNGDDRKIRKVYVDGSKVK
jgi:guanine deaminase